MFPPFLSISLILQIHRRCEDYLFDLRMIVGDGIKLEIAFVDSRMRLEHRLYDELLKWLPEI